ncbi:MAG: MFS transporter [Thermoplasmata archaeon]
MGSRVSEVRPEDKGFKAIPSRVKWLVYLTIPSSMAYGYVIIAISAYLPEIGMSLGDVGLLIGINGLVFVVSAVPIGLLADRKGKKNIFLLGMMGIPPSILVFAFTTELAPLLVATSMAAVCEAAFASTWNVLIADQTTTRNRNQAFSLSFIVGNSAFGIGFAIPFLFPAVQGWTGLTSEEVHNYAFILMAGMAALSPLLLWPLLKRYEENVTPREGFKRGQSNKVLMRFSSINAMIGLGAGFIIPLVPSWLLAKYGVTDAWSGPLLAISNITIGVAAILSPRIANRYGVIKAIVVTQATSTLFMLSMAFMPGAILAASAYLVRAALMNMAVPLLDAYLMGIIEKEERGFASALNSIIWRLPNSVTSIIGAEMLEDGEYDLPIYIATSFYFVGTSMFFLMFKDIKPKEDLVVADAVER